ncbi:MAG TPA: SCO family protein [Acidimicrobiales bacterium]|nr:SCO family protein [Acidimicrobiales bacterium]
MTAGLLVSCGGAGAASAPPAPSASMGNAVDLAVPASIAGFPLLDGQGATTSLSALRGKVVVLAPLLTSCQEECPLTTGAFLAIQRDLSAAGLSDKVTLAELSVDPNRDTPARLAAYAAYTGANWRLLTSTAQIVESFWHHFGVYFEKTPEGIPAGIDWQTGKPYTYDVSHSNGFLVFDPAGHLRFLTVELPDLHGNLGPRLRRLLNDQGLENLDHPDPNQSWTIPQALQAIGWVLGRSIPASG